VLDTAGTRGSWPVRLHARTRAPAFVVTTRVEFAQTSPWSVPRRDYRLASNTISSIIGAVCRPVNRISSWAYFVVIRIGKFRMKYITLLLLKLLLTGCVYPMQDQVPSSAPATKPVLRAPVETEALPTGSIDLARSVPGDMAEHLQVDFERGIDATRNWLSTMSGVDSAKLTTRCAQVAGRPRV